MKIASIALSKKRGLQSLLCRKPLSYRTMGLPETLMQGRLPTLQAGPRFHNLDVNRRDCLCGVQVAAFAQSIDFIYLVKNCRVLFLWTGTSKKTNFCSFYPGT